MKNVQEIIENNLKEYDPSEVFVALDVDLTLTVPFEKAAQFPNIMLHKKLYKTLMDGLTITQQYVILNLLAEASSHYLLEETEVLSLLEHLQDKGIKSIAFSAALSGALTSTPRMEVWRYNMLKDLGVDFSHSFTHTPEITFTDIPAFFERHPVFYKGILCASRPLREDTKGPVLTAFIEKMKLNPKIVIMVDDTKQHLEDIEASLKVYDPKIRFVGIEYIKGREFTSGLISEKEFLAFWEKLVTQVRQVAPGTI